METKRTHLILAGTLMVATAVAGAVARGTSGAPPPAANAKATFAAPAHGPVTFSGTLDRTAVLRGRDGLARIELTLGGAPDPNAPEVRRPTDLAIILDRSGSMSGEKLEQARAAVRELVAQLDDRDRFTLVTYSDDAQIAIPLSSAAARSDWEGTIAGITPMGGTNMASGLDLALYSIERSRAEGRVPHAILISDGLANQGDATQEGLSRRAQRAARGEFMLSTVGVGSDFNEYLMTALADAGTGNYYYLREATGLAEVFAREFDAARTTVARGLAVEIEPGDGIRVVDAAGYPLETVGKTVVFRPGSLFAGQQRRIWVTLAVPQQTLGDYDLGTFALTYGEGSHRARLAFAERPRVACVAGEDEFYSAIDPEAWTRSVVVEGYSKMQEEVAREVKAGRRDEALKRVQRFRDETSEMNARMASPPVEAQLRSVDKLEADVAGAFSGANQAAKQNELSKSSSLGAVDARRAGSKH